LTVLVPWVEPKPDPLITTEVPTRPEFPHRAVIIGITVKVLPLLFAPLAKTITFPVLAVEGTVVWILVALQLATVAKTPLKETVPEPWVVPKLLPEIVTAVPTVPVVTERLEIDGAGTTVKLTPLLFTPLAKTTTLPVVAPEGTVAMMLVALQLVTVALVPLNLTVPEPWVEPKFEPAIVTDAPIAADVGDKLVTLGAGTTVKVMPLLEVLPTVTTTLPVVAPDGTVATIVVFFQLVAVAVTPLNLTVLLPWEDPNPDPLIVTLAPIAPDDGDRLEMLGLDAPVLIAKTKKQINESRTEHAALQPEKASLGRVPAGSEADVTTADSSGNRRATCRYVFLIGLGLLAACSITRSISAPPPQHARQNSSDFVLGSSAARARLRLTGVPNYGAVRSVLKMVMYIRVKPSFVKNFFC
jgi:hypothetical protein